VLSDVQEFLTDVATIERPTVASGFGQTTTWATLATVNGYLRTLSGAESIDYGGDNVRSTHRFVCGIVDVAEKDRIVIDSKTYMIRYVDVKTLYGSSWLQIDCEYVGAAD